MRKKEVSLLFWLGVTGGVHKRENLKLIYVAGHGRSVLGFRPSGGSVFHW